MIEFFFDCSSPWTYLAFHNLQSMARELGGDDMHFGNDRLEFVREAVLRRQAATVS